MTADPSGARGRHAGAFRLLLDHQIFELQRWGGISRYFVELLAGLRRRPAEVDVALTLRRTLSQHRAALAALGWETGTAGFQETFLRGARVPFRPALYRLARRTFPSLDARKVNRAAALAALAAGEFDLFHPTYYDPYFLDALRGRPFVLTVYDLTHEVWPELSPPDPALVRAKAELARRATRVIAISESTRRDAVALLGLDPARVDVVHLGFERSFEDEQPPPPGLPERYVLFTGVRGGYKNWAFTVRALAPLLRDTPGLALVCTGSPFQPAERALVASLGLERAVRHVAAGEGTLPALYARAAAFVFPSLHEGFGLPVLEAFSAGCPAVLARRTSLPEVGGDAAIYFDPRDAQDLCEAVHRALSDRALAAGLVERGRARLKVFGWAQAVEAHLATYRRALGEPG